MNTNTRNQQSPWKEANRRRRKYKHKKKEDASWNHNMVWKPSCHKKPNKQSFEEHGRRVGQKVFKTTEEIHHDKQALKIHGIAYIDDGFPSDSDSRKSSFDEDYYQNKPQPIKIDRSRVIVIEKRKYKKEQITDGLGDPQFCYDPEEKFHHAQEQKITDGLGDVQFCYGSEEKFRDAQKQYFADGLEDLQFCYDWEEKFYHAQEEQFFHTHSSLRKQQEFIRAQEKQQPSNAQVDQLFCDGQIDPPNSSCNNSRIPQIYDHVLFTNENINDNTGEKTTEDQINLFKGLIIHKEAKSDGNIKNNHKKYSSYLADDLDAVSTIVNMPEGDFLEPASSASMSNLHLTKKGKDESSLGEIGREPCWRFIFSWFPRCFCCFLRFFCCCNESEA